MQKFYLQFVSWYVNEIPCNLIFIFHYGINELCLLTCKDLKIYHKKTVANGFRQCMSALTKSAVKDRFQRLQKSV